MEFRRMYVNQMLMISKWNSIVGCACVSVREKNNNNNDQKNTLSYETIEKKATSKKTTHNSKWMFIDNV